RPARASSGMPRALSAQDQCPPVHPRWMFWHRAERDAGAAVPLGVLAKTRLPLSSCSVNSSESAAQDQCAVLVGKHRCRSTAAVLVLRRRPARWDQRGSSASCAQNSPQLLGAGTSAKRCSKKAKASGYAAIAVATWVGVG